MMRSRQFLALIGLAVLLPTGVARAVSIEGLFTTGVDTNGDLLNPGDSDPHYGRTVLSKHFDWVSPLPGSLWIGPPNGNVSAPAGSYSYSAISFDLSGLDPDSAVIIGKIALDDAGGVLLNGIFISIPAPHFALTDFMIEDGFVSGINTFSIFHNNASTGPTGILIASLSGSANVIPEPSTLTLAALALFALLAHHRRHRA